MFNFKPMDEVLIVKGPYEGHIGLCLIIEENEALMDLGHGVIVSLAADCFE